MKLIWTARIWWEQTSLSSSSLPETGSKLNATLQLYHHSHKDFFFHLFYICSKPYAPDGILLGRIMITFCMCNILLILACFSFFPLSTEGKTFAVQHPFRHHSIQTRTGAPHWCLWCSCTFFERNCAQMWTWVLRTSMFPTSIASIAIINGDYLYFPL